MRLNTEELAWESMRKGIDGQVDLLRTAPRTLLTHAARALEGPAPSKIYFTGCGDSYFCGLAARYATERMSGIATEALEALEFSRYAVRTAPPGSLVVGVSNSGDVARTVEALQFARQRGLRTIGVTYNAESRLAANSDGLMTFDYRDVGFGPGTMSYMASVISLLAVGARAGELSGKLSAKDVEEHAKTIEALAPALRATIDATEEPARELAASLSEATDIFMVGGGPNYATALFSMAKMIEAARHNTVAQQLEEWAHEQYFCCAPGTVTIVIAPPGASLDRAREQLEAVRDMKGTAAVVCAADDTVTAALADVVFPVSGEVDEDLSPLVYLVASELLSMHFAIRTKRVMLGFDDQWRKEVNFRQIFGSKIPSSIEQAGATR